MYVKLPLKRRPTFLSAVPLAVKSACAQGNSSPNPAPLWTSAGASAFFSGAFLGPPKPAPPGPNGKPPRGGCIFCHSAAVISMLNWWIFVKPKTAVAAACCFLSGDFLAPADCCGCVADEDASANARQPMATHTSRMLFNMEMISGAREIRASSLQVTKPVCVPPRENRDRSGVLSYIATLSIVLFQ